MICQICNIREGEYQDYYDEVICNDCKVGVEIEEIELAIEENRQDEDGDSK